jgi:hypothetical protein
MHRKKLDKVQNPVILSVIRHRQNPLESTLIHIRHIKLLCSIPQW